MRKQAHQRTKKKNPPPLVDKTYSDADLEAWKSATQRPSKSSKNSQPTKSLLTNEFDKRLLDKRLHQLHKPSTQKFSKPPDFYDHYSSRVVTLLEEAQSLVSKNQSSEDYETSLRSCVEDLHQKAVFLRTSTLKKEIEETVQEIDNLEKENTGLESMLRSHSLLMDSQDIETHQIEKLQLEIEALELKLKKSKEKQKTLQETQQIIHDDIAATTDKCKEREVLLMQELENKQSKLNKNQDKQGEQLENEILELKQEGRELESNIEELENLLRSTIDDSSGAYRDVNKQIDRITAETQQIKEVSEGIKQTRSKVKDKVRSLKSTRHEFLQKSISPNHSELTDNQIKLLVDSLLTHAAKKIIDRKESDKLLVKNIMRKMEDGQHLNSSVKALKDSFLSLKQAASLKEIKASPVKEIPTADLPISRKIEYAAFLEQRKIGLNNL